jgi:zinc transport system substrate-binding protein
MLYVNFVEELMTKQMRRVLKYFFFLLFISCNTQGPVGNKKIISVSIPPFKYFTEAIGGDDFIVNVMVPAGANPHIYEPVPGQISALRKSVAFISNGYLGFEMTWLDRFYETNRNMKKLSLGDNIDLIKAAGHSDDGHIEGADPHYWVSAKCAKVIASTVKDFLCELKPGSKEKYEKNYSNLVNTISEIDQKATDLFSGYKGRSFMIYHPTLGYFARDYGLIQIAVENEGKEPTPSTLKELIDNARSQNIKVIFVQREYDTKNARAIASESGAVIESIDPLSENWPEAMMEIIKAIHESIVKSGIK